MKKIVKKVIFLVILCIIVFCIFNLIFFFFKKSHYVQYKINDNNTNYVIDETFKDNKYYFNIKTDKYSFSINVDNNYNKKKKVIKDIKYYEYEEYGCIYVPNIDSNIVCSDGNINYSYNSSKGFIGDFINNLKTMGYENVLWNDDSTNNIKKDNVTVYQDNMIDNSYIYLYKYNGFYSVNKSNINVIDLFDKDYYFNDYGVLVGKYYLIFNLDDKYEFNSLKVIDVTTNKEKIINLKNSISKNSYVIGTVSNKVYYFDSDNVIEYEVDPVHRKVTVIGNKDINGKYYDGTWKNCNIYDFRNKDFKFVEKNDFDGEYSNISNYLDIYYYSKDENVYSYDMVTNVTTLLFSFSNFSDIYNSNGDLYVLFNNSIYMYHNGTLRKVISYDELKFNNINRYAVYSY